LFPVSEPAQEEPEDEMNPSITLFILVLATFACAFAATLAPNRDGRDLARALYMWGIGLIGRCIAAVMIIQAVAVGLRIMGILR